MVNFQIDYYKLYLHRKLDMGMIKLNSIIKIYCCNLFSRYA